MKSDLSNEFGRIRRLFPHTRDFVYFNCAANGPLTVNVKRVIDEYVDGCVEGGRSFDVESADVRKGYARLIGATIRQIGLAHNTSVGLNIAAFGLPLKRGDEILVSDVEFPAIVYVWKAAAEERGLKLKFVRSRNGCFDIDAFKKALTRRTKVLSLSWVQFFNGYKVDLKELTAICRERGIYTVIDGIQGVGAEPINVRSLGIDVFSSGCHKWLLAPIGCGFFYLSDEVMDRMQRPFAYWLGVDWNDDFTRLLDYERATFNSARRFEIGFVSSVNLLGMQESLKLFRLLGPANIKRHNYALIDRLVAYLRRTPYYRITSAMETKHRSSIVTFTCDRVKKLHKRLVDERIILVEREGSVRVSVHLFNNEQDIDRLIGVLDSFYRG